jgi:hypothetical protein
MRSAATWMAVKQLAGAALGVLPARRRCRELQAENNELRHQVAELELGLQQCDLRPLVAAVDATVVALEETVGARRYLRAVD